MWSDSAQAQLATDVSGYIRTLLTTIVSVVGGVGSVIAVAKTSNDLLQNRTLLAKRNSELQRASGFVDLLGKFSNDKVQKEHQEGLSKAVHACLQQSLANVEKLNLRLAAISLDPNSGLKVHEKLFLTFSPANWRGWALHLLTYMSLAWGGWYIFRSGVSGGTFSLRTFVSAWHSSLQYLALAFILVVVTVFRSWALEERRRSLGFRKPAGRVARFLAMRFPESWRMLAAQIMFFFSSMVLLTVIHTYILGTYKGATATVVLWLAAFTLFLALIFRKWALAELAFQEHKPAILPWKRVLFAGFFTKLHQYGLLRLVSLSALLASSILFAGLIVLEIAAIALRSGAAVMIFIIVLQMSVALVVYGLLRSLRIMYSLEEGSARPESGLALSAPA